MVQLWSIVKVLYQTSIQTVKRKKGTHRQIYCMCVNIFTLYRGGGVFHLLYFKNYKFSSSTAAENRQKYIQQEAQNLILLWI